MKQCKVNKWFLTKRGIGNDKVVHPFECIRMPLDFAMLSKRLPRATARATPFKKDKLFALAPLLECVSLFLYVSSPFKGPPRDPLLRRKSRSRASHGKVPSPLMQYKVSGWYRKARECGKWSTGSRKAQVYSEKDVYLQSCSTPLPSCRLHSTTFVCSQRVHKKRSDKEFSAHRSLLMIMKILC